MSATQNTPEIAVVGAGGYAMDVLRLLRREAGAPRVAACCDPDAEKRGAVTALFEGEVPLFTDIDEMLAALPASVRGVWLPVPIHLHVAFVEKVLRSGRAVMCEKPPAGTVQEVDELSRLADEHRESVGVSEPVLIGYQHLYQPQTRRLKAALLGGAIGRIDRASVLACWPRADSYYARNDWAGALKRGGRWVLDSPANNALAHMLNLSLFLLGDTPDTPADIERVEAELYRANPIENYDTCALRATLAGRKRLTIFMTHACAQRDGPHITIDGDAGGATWSSEHGMTIGDEAFAVNFGERRSMLKAWRSVLEGEALPGDVGHLATPAAVRAQTVLVNAASAGTVVHDFDADAVAVEEGVKHVPGIEAELEACHREGRLPSERGATWARPAGTIEVGPAFAFTGIPG